MRRILLFAFMFILTTVAYSQQFGKPIFCTEDDNPFSYFALDSAGTQYFYRFGSSLAHVYDQKADSLIPQMYISMRDSVYEVRYISDLVFGKKSKLQIVVPAMKGVYGQDSAIHYLYVENQDSAMSWRYTLGEYSIAYQKNISKVIYADNKYWLFGNYKRLLTIDENTLEIDSVMLGDEKYKIPYIWPALINQYKNGLLYVTFDSKYLHYVSSDEYYSISIDSIITEQYPKFYHLKSIKILGNKAYMLDVTTVVLILDLDTHELEVFDVDKGILHEFLKDDNLNTDSFASEIKVTNNGDIYLSYISNSRQEYKMFYIDEDRNPSLPSAPYMNEVTMLMPTPFGYYYLAGQYENPDSDTNWVAVPYYPNGTSVESVPTMLGMKVAPNPAMLTTTVEFYLRPDLVDDLKFTVYNYLGGVIDKLDSNVEYDNGRFFASKRIDVTKYKTGIYYLVIDNGEEQKMVGFAVN